MTQSQRALALNNNTPSTFNFSNHAVRIVMRDGEPWFVAADLCRALELTSPTKALLALGDEEKALISIQGLSRGNDQANIVSESGMYTLVLRCRDAVKPGTVAYRFRRWVTSEVLPQIRKTGSYGTPRIDPAALLIDDYPELTLPLPPGVQRALDLRAWKLAGEAYGLIHEHLRRRVAANAAIGHPDRHIDQGRALTAIASGDLGDALAYSWVQKMQFLIVNAQVQAQAAADCAANMRAAIGLSR